MTQISLFSLEPPISHQSLIDAHNRQYAPSLADKKVALTLEMGLDPVSLNQEGVYLLRVFLNQQLRRLKNTTAPAPKALFCRALKYEMTLKRLGTYDAALLVRHLLVQRLTREAPFGTIV